MFAVAITAPASLAAAPAITASLPSNPLCGVVVPIMAAVRELRQGGFNVVPAPLVLKTAPAHFADQGASTAGTGALVEFGNQRIWQSYVYSHGPSVALTGCVFGRRADRR